MQPILNQEGHIARSLLIGLIGLLIPAVLMIVVYTDRSFTPERQKHVEQLIQVTPRIGEMLPPERLGGRRLELFRLPGPLGKTSIHALSNINRTLWLGTDSGLIRFEPDGKSKLYRNFSKAAKESIHALTPVGTKIAVSITVTNSGAPTTPTGTFLFDPKTETWQRIGSDSRSLAWDGNRLWALQGRTLSVFIEQPDGSWQQQAIATDHKLCSTGSLTFAEGHLWIVQVGPQQQVDNTELKKNWSREIACGVLSINTDTGTERLYTTEDGLEANSGHAIVADEQATWVAHSGVDGGLSFYAKDRQQWVALPKSTNDYPLTANLIALSDEAVWLGTTVEEWPLIRLDRETLEAGSISDAPAGYSVTAMASHPGAVWVALSKIVEQDEDGNTRLDTVFGRIRK